MFHAVDRCVRTVEWISKSFFPFWLSFADSDAKRLTDLKKTAGMDLEHKEWRKDHMRSCSLLLTLRSPFVVVVLCPAFTFHSRLLCRSVYSWMKDFTEEKFHPQETHTQASLSLLSIGYKREQGVRSRVPSFLVPRNQCSLRVRLDNSSRNTAVVFLCDQSPYTRRDRERFCMWERTVCPSNDYLSSLDTCALFSHQLFLPPSSSFAYVDVCIRLDVFGSFLEKESARGSRTREAISDVYQKVFRTHIIIASYSHTIGVWSTDLQLSNKQKSHWISKESEKWVTEKLVESESLFVSRIVVYLEEGRSLFSLSPETNSALNTQTPGEKSSRYAASQTEEGKMREEGEKDGVAKKRTPHTQYTSS